jgi:hypothetical protein
MWLSGILGDCGLCLCGVCECRSLCSVVWLSGVLKHWWNLLRYVTYVIHTTLHHYTILPTHSLYAYTAHTHTHETHTRTSVHTLHTQTNKQILKPGLLVSMDSSLLSYHTHVHKNCDEGGCSSRNKLHSYSLLIALYTMCIIYTWHIMSCSLILYICGTVSKCLVFF